MQERLMLVKGVYPPTTCGTPASLKSSVGAVIKMDMF
jgi:hypothetical protein